MKSCRYIALLRAINVGGRGLKMTALRALFEAMKFEDVETFIASGNVIFRSKADPAKLETQIEKRLEKTLGYRVTYIPPDTRGGSDSRAAVPVRSADSGRWALVRRLRPK